MNKGQLFNQKFFDVAEPYQLSFQDPATDIMEGIINLHNTIMYYLVIIIIFVSWILVNVLSKNHFSHANLNHGTLIEIIWTITPALILINIALPSFKLLYMMDEVIDPIITIKTIGLLSFAPRTPLQFREHVWVRLLTSTNLWFVVCLFFRKTGAEANGGLKLYILNKKKDTLNLFNSCPDLWSDRPEGNKDNFLVPYQWSGHEFVGLYNAHRTQKGAAGNKLGVKKFIQLFSFAGLCVFIFIFYFSFYIPNVRANKRNGPHNKEVLSVIIGSLLGDCYGNRKSKEGLRFVFKQSIKNKEYLMWLYQFFFDRGYCSNLIPKQYFTKLKVRSEIKEYSRLPAQRGIPGASRRRFEFNTFTFRSFNWIHKMFYKKGVKYIHPDIEHYLDPLALAIWIMDDGCWANPGVRIATNSFKYKELKILVKILKIKFNLNCTLQNIQTPGQYSIYIKSDSIPLLRNLVLPYFVKSMIYKLGLPS